MRTRFSDDPLKTEKPIRTGFFAAALGYSLVGVRFFASKALSVRDKPADQRKSGEKCRRSRPTRQAGGEIVQPCRYGNGLLFLIRGSVCLHGPILPRASKIDRGIRAFIERRWKKLNHLSSWRKFHRARRSRIACVREKRNLARRIFL
jgi:hypothetical protein